MDKNQPAPAAVVVTHERILGGRPVFRGTRVPVEVLFENLAEGYSVDDVAANFPTLDPSDLRTALLQACEMIKEAAPDITPETDKTSAHARLLR